MTLRIPAALLFANALAATPLAAQDDMRRIALGGGDTVTVTQSGSGPAVVLVPGLLGAAYSYRKVIPQLAAAGMSVIVIEPLGVGYSSRPKNGDYSLETQATRIERVLDELAIDSAIFVCHSVGGSMCYRLALRAPQRVRGIVALNAGADERAATSGLRFAMRFAPMLRVLGSGNAKKRVRDGLIESSADPAWVTAEAMDAYTRPFTDLSRALDALRGMSSAKEPLPLAPRLSELRRPVRLLVGAGGKSMTAEDIEALTSRLPDIQVERVHGAGQYIQEEAPGAIVEAVAALRAQLARGNQRSPPR
jgi:pimeloyl-ACP methyl ester carboxylesterase